jgi:hypothetical protein
MGRRQAKWRRGLSPEKVGMAASRGGMSSPVDSGGSGKSLKHRGEWRGCGAR